MRFVVHELYGFALGSRKGTSDVTVWDTWFSPWREVRTFYSSPPRDVGGAWTLPGTTSLGQAEALRRAREMCRRLNCEAETEDWSTWVPDGTPLCRRGHRVGPENLRLDRTGYACRACQRESDARGRQRKKQAAK